MITNQQFPTDHELLPIYLDVSDKNNNEPVGIWMDLKYRYPLWLYAKNRLNYDSHRAFDALHDTAERMCRWKGDERGQKFTIIPEQVLSALHFRVRDACHAITRPKSAQKEIFHAPDDLPYNLIDEQDLRELVKMERRHEIVKTYVLERWGEEEWLVVKLLFKHGRQARSHIIQQLDWSENKTHRMITKINRHLKKLRLQDV